MKARKFKLSKRHPILHLRSALLLSSHNPIFRASTLLVHHRYTLMARRDIQPLPRWVTCAPRRTTANTIFPCPYLQWQCRRVVRRIYRTSVTVWQSFCRSRSLPADKGMLCQERDSVVMLLRGRIVECRCALYRRIHGPVLGFRGRAQLRVWRIWRAGNIVRFILAFIRRFLLTIIIFTSSYQARYVSTEPFRGTRAVSFP